jgi:hypothetical protein
MSYPTAIDVNNLRNNAWALRLLRIIRASLLLPLFLLGCDAGNGRIGLEGTVTLDGTPLDEGNIAFRPLPGTKGPTAGGSIKNGKYSVRSDEGLFPGSYRVDITASRKTGKKTKDLLMNMMIDELEQFLPAKYNTKSELTAEVTDRGTNHINFDLHSEG